MECYKTCHTFPLTVPAIHMGSNSDLDLDRFGKAVHIHAKAPGPSAFDDPDDVDEHEPARNGAISNFHPAENHEVDGHAADAGHLSGIVCELDVGTALSNQPSALAFS
jgi:hypothetical protein